jgi:4-amino-4-deoxy-L-arabinose transferase-like glycosyltransferase
VLAGVARFAAIGSRLHVDDAYTWLVASQPNLHAFLHQLAATENTPPLSYLLLTPLPISSPVWLRLPATIAGILMCVVLYLALRRALGARVALLAALGVAASPFLITYSDLARGFMLEDLALLVALWAVLALGMREAAGGRGERRWWIAFVLAGIVALYTEYSAAIFLLALTASALWLGRPARRRVLVAAALPFISLIPWIPQIVHAENQVGVTKLHPMFATPSLRVFRDSVVILAFGEGGGTSSSAGRWLELAAIVALVVLAAVVVGRSRFAADPRRRFAITLLASTTALTLIGHAIAPLVGVDVFTQRYMTVLIPLAAALGAAAIVSTGSRPLFMCACALLAAVCVFEAVRRYHGEYEPSIGPVRQAAIADHPRTVLTNTPIVLFYLRSLHPVFDRPSNLGPGQAATCARPCLIIDDSRAYGGSPRQASGTSMMIGPYVLTLER